MTVENDNVAILALLERLVELDPSDVDTRFELAYKYSEMGHHDLAVYHYIRIPSEERTGITWNNLGVAFGSLELPARSICAYRKGGADG